MALQTDRQTFEAEKWIGAASAQTLVRAEALIHGAGRDAIEPMLADADLFINQTEVQNGRVVIEGSVSCQAVYRQGDESNLRALTARAALNQVLEIPDAKPGMLCRVRSGVEHVEARYENGHMVFQVTCAVTVQVLSLEPVEVITGVSGAEELQTVYQPIRSVKLGAEASEMALLKDSVPLPAVMDARAALMDWIAVEVDEVAPDLGGVRVKGRAMVETLVSSGAPGRPAVVVRYPLVLDQLVELPEWLTGDTRAEVDVRSVRSQVEPGDADGEMKLSCEAEVRVRVLANVIDSAGALTDAYATGSSTLRINREEIGLCSDVDFAKVSEMVRGTALTGEDSKSAGIVLAAQATLTVSEWRDANGQGRIEGVAEVRVLYVPGGAELPAVAETELPFSLSVPQQLNEDSLIDVKVLSAEANALMSDRLEVKLQLIASCETRQRTTAQIVTELEPGESVPRSAGIVISWPAEGESAWDIGKRYAVPADSVGEVEPGKPVVLVM